MSAPAVAVSRDGKKVAAAWMDRRGGSRTRQVHWAESAAAGGSFNLAFKKDSPIEPNSSHSQDHPALAFDEADTLWAAWEEKEKEKDGAAKQTVWIRSLASSLKPLQLSEDGHVNAAYPAVASGGGVTCVVYEAGSKGDKVVVFRRVAAK